MQMHKQSKPTFIIVLCWPILASIGERTHKLLNYILGHSLPGENAFSMFLIVHIYPNLITVFSFESFSCKM